VTKFLQKIEDQFDSKKYRKIGQLSHLERAKPKNAVIFVQIKKGNFPIKIPLYLGCPT